MFWTDKNGDEWAEVLWPIDREKIGYLAWRITGEWRWVRIRKPRT